MLEKYLSFNTTTWNNV